MQVRQTDGQTKIDRRDRQTKIKANKTETEKDRK